VQRITISLDDELARQFDDLIRERGYSNRSEAMRDLIREELDRARLDSSEPRDCVATLSYVFNHHERELAQRLTRTQHDHHHLGVTTLHSHLDHDNCLEVALLHGDVAAVRAFADAVTHQRGVRHGSLHIIPADLQVDDHDHGAGTPGGRHLHSHPKS